LFSVRYTVSSGEEALFQLVVPSRKGADSLTNNASTPPAWIEGP